MFRQQLGLAVLVLLAIGAVGCSPEPIKNNPEAAVVPQVDPDKAVQVVKTEAPPQTAPKPTQTSGQTPAYELDGMTLKPKSEERPMRPIPELLAALKAETWEERTAAVEDLGRSGDTSDEVIDALVNMYNDTHGQVYFAAADALKRIGTKAVPKVIEGLKFEGENARFAAAYTLKGINPPPAEALQPLLDVLADEGTYVRMYAVIALSHLRAAAEPAIPALEAVAADENEDAETREYARRAVENIKKHLTAEQQ